MCPWPVTWFIYVHHGTVDDTTSWTEILPHCIVTSIHQVLELSLILSRYILSLFIPFPVSKEIVFFERNSSFICFLLYCYKILYKRKWWCKYRILFFHFLPLFTLSLSLSFCFLWTRFTIIPFLSLSLFPYLTIYFGSDRKIPFEGIVRILFKAQICVCVHTLWYVTMNFYWFFVFWYQNLL